MESRAILAGAPLFVVLCAGAAVVYPPAIESALTDACESALADAGVPDASLVVDGREAVVTLPPTPSARQRAVRAALDRVEGLRTASVRLADPLPEARVPWLRIARRAGVVEVFGNLPAADHEGLTRGISAALGARSRSALTDGETSAPWSEAFLGALDGADDVDRLVLEVRGGRALLRAIVDSQERRAALVETVGRALPELPLKEDVIVRSETPALAPPLPEDPRP